MLMEKTVDSVRAGEDILHVPGLVVRGFRGEGDYPAMLSVIEAS